MKSIEIQPLWLGSGNLWLLPVNLQSKGEAMTTAAGQVGGGQ